MNTDAGDSASYSASSGEIPNARENPVSHIGNETHMTPLLSAVSSEEDRAIILDVLSAIKACRQPDQLCVSWSVAPVSSGYIITAYLPKPSSNRGSNLEITHDDLGMIESVNLLRVRAGVAHLSADTWGLRIHITGHKTPVSYTTYDTLRFTQRRMSLWGALPALGRSISGMTSSGMNTLEHLMHSNGNGSGNRQTMHDGMMGVASGPVFQHSLPAQSSIGLGKRTRDTH